MRVGKPPQSEPPCWLQVGDESWGPAGSRNKLSFGAIATALLVAVPAFFGAYWLHKLTQIDSPLVYLAGTFGGILTGAGVIVGMACVSVEIARQQIKKSRGHLKVGRLLSRSPLGIHEETNYSYGKSDEHSRIR
jgi:hypothetical protein